MRIEKNKKINLTLKVINNEKCSTKFWDRYVDANNIFDIAKENNVSSYTLIYGSSYEKRRISALLQYNALSSTSSLISKVPTEYLWFFGERGSKKLFNTLIKHDNQCYLKLK